MGQSAIPTMMDAWGMTDHGNEVLGTGSGWGNYTPDTLVFNHIPGGSNGASVLPFIMGSAGGWG